MTEQERRFTSFAAAKPKISKRADGKSVIEGYAAVFYRASDPGTEYDLGYGIRERISRGAFTRALREKQDVACRFDHEELLGRSTSGTLRLKEDDIGLWYEVDIPETQCGRDTATMIERGDIQGASFAFRATKVEWLDQGETGTVRSVEDCELYDVGPVVFPAYTATSTAVRAGTPENATLIKTECDEWRKSQNASANNEADEVELRLALVNLDD